MSVQSVASVEVLYLILGFIREERLQTEQKLL